MRQTLSSPRGMVTAPHHLAASSASAVLREGGNAIDAMVAAAATTAVVGSPSSTAPSTWCRRRACCSSRCFTGPELAQTFTDLVKWVEQGVKPEGDDVLNPAAVADPAFGCKFTDKVSPRQWDALALAFLKPPSCP